MDEDLGVFFWKWCYLEELPETSSWKRVLLCVLVLLQAQSHSCTEPHFLFLC